MDSDYEDYEDMLLEKMMMHDYWNRSFMKAFLEKQKENNTIVGDLAGFSPKDSKGEKERLEQINI